MSLRYRLAALCIGALGLASAAHAQTYDLRFVTAFPTPTTFRVTVQTRLAAGSAQLGSSNFVFTYNAAALSIPATPTDGADFAFAAFDNDTNPAYGNATATTSPAGRVSLNIELNTDNAGTVVPSTFTDVASVTFTVTDAAAMSTLAFNAPQTVAYGGDNATEFTQGSFAGSSQTLPVELSAFTAVQSGPGAVAVSWTTASETSNGSFTVEMRAPALPGAQTVPAWTDVRVVEGRGTTSEAHSYRYDASGLRPGTYRFRLRQTDIDGSAQTTPEVEVLVEAPRVLALDAPYPNPARSRANIAFTVPDDGAARLDVFDVTGRHVATLFDAPAIAGRLNAASLDADTLASGLYIVRLSHARGTRTRTLTLIR